MSRASPGLLGWTPATSLLQRTVLLCLPLHHLAKYHLQTKPSSVLWGRALGQVKTTTPYYCTVPISERDKNKVPSPHHVHRQSAYWNKAQVEADISQSPIRQTHATRSLTCRGSCPATVKSINSYYRRHFLNHPSVVR